MDSLEQRKQKIFEEGCAACGMSVGGDGFEASSDASGPTAGYDPLMKTVKMLRRNKKKRKEQG